MYHLRTKTEENVYSQDKVVFFGFSSQQHAYSNVLKILQSKTENFQMKSDIFHISAQNVGESIQYTIG